MKRVMDSFFVSGTKVLGDENGYGLGAAVTECVDHALHAHGCCIRGDGGGAKGVDGTLDQKLADVETGLLQGGDDAIAECLFQKSTVESQIGFSTEQSGVTFF